MRLRKDSPEYFPPAGEAPPAAPVMAAAALQTVDFYTNFLFQDRDKFQNENDDVYKNDWLT